MSGEVVEEERRVDETSSEEPLVAVVTPFYNGEAELAACIESVQAQTYSNWRHLLLDNCSTDDSRAIARRFAEEDERIHLVEADEFVGQLANFNRALELVPPEAEYVKMVFADDLLLERCLEEMVALAEREPSVCMVSAYVKVDRHIFLDGLPLDVEVLTGEEIFRHFVDDVSLFASPTALLFRADAVRSRRPFFRENVKVSDADACFSLLEHGDLGFVHQVLTCFGMDDEALTPELLKFRPAALGRFLMVCEHAHRFLGPEEARETIGGMRSAYYKVLGEEAVRLRGRDFWRFHREALAEIGESIEWSRLLAHVGMAAIREVLMAPYTLPRALRDLLSGRRERRPDEDGAGGREPGPATPGA